MFPPELLIAPTQPILADRAVAAQPVFSMNTPGLLASPTNEIQAGPTGALQAASSLNKRAGSSPDSTCGNKRPRHQPIILDTVAELQMTQHADDNMQVWRLVDRTPSMSLVVQTLI